MLASKVRLWKRWSGDPLRKFIVNFVEEPCQYSRRAAALWPADLSRQAARSAASATLVSILPQARDAQLLARSRQTQAVLALEQ
jgi:hypothetical protein